MDTGGGGTHRDSPIGNVFPASWMCPQGQGGPRWQLHNSDSPHQAVVEPRPTGSTAAGPLTLTVTWEVFEASDLRVTGLWWGDVGQEHPRFCTGSPKEGFAQTYSKVQPWESSEISPIDLSGMANSKITTHGETAHRHLETINWSASRNLSFKNRNGDIRGLGLFRSLGLCGSIIWLWVLKMLFDSQIVVTTAVPKQEWVMQPVVVCSTHSCTSCLQVLHC